MATKNLEEKLSELKSKIEEQSEVIISLRKIGREADVFVAQDKLFSLLQEYEEIEKKGIVEE